MSFLRKLGYRIAVWMRGRNGVDQLALASLAVSLLLQVIGAAVGAPVLTLISMALYLWTLFRVFSPRSARRTQENMKLMTAWNRGAKGARQFLLRQKLRKQYKYFRCPQCKTLLRLNRGGGEREISCPKCQNKLKIKT